MLGRRGQMTVFVIIGIVLIVAIVGFFVFRGSLTTDTLPQEFQPVYDYYLACVEDNTLGAIRLVENQGGYVDAPAFEAGSNYMPFSNQFDFLGFSVPYWYYVSGNGIQKTQVPKLSQIQEALEENIKDGIENCDLSVFEAQGYSVNFKEAKVSVKINRHDVDVNVKMPLSISKGELSSQLSSHEVIVDSELGDLYDAAKKIYNTEMESLFLENYAVDTLHLYAPVTGVELDCGPKTWQAGEVVEGVQLALEANMANIKSEGNYYKLSDDKNKYFVRDLGTDKSVNFLYSKDWPFKLEITPAEGNLLIAEPVGNQKGLGILGFCYVPYHFVYDLAFPVLVQVYSGDTQNGASEFFQFPVAVVVKNNLPREESKGTALILEESEICKYKNSEIVVNVYDTKLRPVDADISFKCMTSNCGLGKTSSGTLIADAPACVNGFVIARAEGYATNSEVISSNEEIYVDIILDRMYNVNLGLFVDDKKTNDRSIISFVSDDNSVTVIYPDQKKVELSEGLYDVSVQVFSSTNIKFAEQTKEQCIEVEDAGIVGLFGGTEEKCFDVTIPAQTISDALSAGGSLNGIYIFESELINGDLEIYSSSLTKPNTLEDIEKNYIAYEDRTVELIFT